MIKVKCEHCGKDVSVDDSACPPCEDSDKKVYSLSIGQQAFYFIIAIGILLIVVIGLDMHFESKKTDVHKQRVSEVLELYKISKQSGEHDRICLHARMLTSSYLQANDEAKYIQWKAIEEDECRQ